MVAKKFIFIQALLHFDLVKALDIENISIGKKMLTRELGLRKILQPNIIK